MPTVFDLQGHRGARGLKPENTLPGFEMALDLGASSIETDVHLSRDGVAVLVHDGTISPTLYSLGTGGGAPDPAQRPRVASLTLDQLRRYRVDRNPDPSRFPKQDTDVGTLTCRFAEERKLNPLSPPTLADLFAFVAAYAGEPGEKAGKSEAQRKRAGKVRLDLELKRLPFFPETIGDGWDGQKPGPLEKKLVAIVQAAGAVARTAVRSFDHRCVKHVRQLEPQLTGQVLVAETAPVSPGKVASSAGAKVYCPDFQFLDRQLIRQAHDEGVQVLPWTVNDPDAWEKLVDWGVDGITTDFPDRLADWLQRKHINF
jgi:glycerophosphoryl diester phosphodiesterase